MDSPDIPGPEQVRREWRSLLLFEIRDELPTQWGERLGTLDAIKDEGFPEPTAEFLGATSPIAQDQLEAMEPDAIFGVLRDWTPSTSQSLHSPSLEGLARVASEVIVRRIKDFATLGPQIAGLRGEAVASVTSLIERELREKRVPEPAMAIRIVLDVAEALPNINENDRWTRQVARDIAGAIAFAASEEFLTEPDGARALALLQILLRNADPTPESQERDVAGGYDVGMLALNSVRGGATTAVIELILESRRANRLDLVEATSAALRMAVASDHSRSVRAAIGVRLPWLLVRYVSHQADWLRLLFDSAVPEIATRSTWDAYLIYSRFFTDTAQILAEQYGAALDGLSARAKEDRGRPMDADEQLGIHVAMAHLNALAFEEEGHWLARFYDGAADWLRARTTRWIAERAAAEGLPPEARTRARVFLIGRVERADVSDDADEMKAMGWVAGANDHEGEVLERILLPALERSGGAIENEPGVAGLIARCASDSPVEAAKALRLVVDGDPWQSLPHVAPAEIRRALDTLMASVEEARLLARDVINTLGARGFLEYRDLLGEASPGADEGGL